MSIAWQERMHKTSVPECVKMASRKPLQTRASPSKTTKQDDAREEELWWLWETICRVLWRKVEAGWTREKRIRAALQKRGSIVREGCKSLRLTSDTRKVGNLRTGALKEAVLRSVAILRDGNMEPEEFRQGVRRRYCDVQSKSRWKSAARKTLNYLVTSKTLSNNVFIVR